MTDPSLRPSGTAGAATSTDAPKDDGSDRAALDPGGSGGGRGRRLRTLSIIALVAIASLLVVVVAAAASVRFILDDEILPGTSIAGVDVGGLSTDDAAAALAPTVAARETDPVTVRFEDGTRTLQPTDLAYAVDVDATLDRAARAGREDGLLQRSLNEVTSFWTSRTVPLAVVFDQAALDSWVDGLAMQVDRDPFPGDVRADPETLTVTTTPPDEGLVLQPTATRDALLDALRSPGAETIDAPVEVLPARVPAADVEAVAADVRIALEAPAVLNSPTGAEVALAPAELAPLIGLTEVKDGDDWTVNVSIAPDGLEQVVGEDAGAFEVEPVNARFEVPREPPVILDDKNDVSWEPRPVEVGIVPSQDGRTFDAALAAGQLAEMIATGVRTAELRTKPIGADFSTQDATDLNVDHLLGTFTTYHACCASRVRNIQLLADMVDETVVLPGEQFSINQISGTRTCSRGFRPAGMILNGEIVDVCGGGVSQFGTTAVNAVFFSGLQPDTYKPHSFYISRYPMGREATLNYPNPDIDVRFTNDTGNGVFIRTWYTPTSITVSFYGNSDVEKVTAIHGSPRSIRPYPTRYKENKSLAPGTSRRTQSGKNGFSITVTRVVVRNGEEARDDWSWDYVPEPQIIERNTTPPPPPPPAPKPEPEPPPEEPAPE